MKERHLYSPRSKTFRGYVFSYIGVVLIALALLSILAVWQITARMQKEAARVLENKLYTITNDLENQFMDMRTAALKIASTEEFSQGYFTENKYREIELLAELRKYFSGVLADSFFLKYPGRENVFISVGTTMPLKLYLQEYLDTRQAEELEFLLEAVSVEAKDKLLLYKMEDGPAFFLYPLTQYSVGNRGGAGVLCFVVTEQNLTDRMIQMAGQIAGEIAIYYEDTLISGQPQEGKYLEAFSSGGKIRVLCWQEQEGYVAWETLFSARDWMLLGCITFGLLTLACLAALRSYRPILELSRKYRDSMGNDINNDLDGIDMLLDTLLRREENNSKRLQEQYQLIREQTVRLIARGGYSDKIGERLPMLNLHLDAAVFCIMQCDLSMLKNTEEQMEGLCREIEDLSEEGEWLYPCAGEHGILWVLAAREEEYQAEEIREAIDGLFEALGIATKMNVVEICHDIRKLGRNEKVSLPEEDATGTGEQDKSTPEISLPEEKSSSGEEALFSDIPEKTAEGAARLSGRKKITAQAAIQYIAENCTRYDLSLDMVADEFNITPTYLCRIIKQQMGISYKEYLTGLRMDAAKKMLREEDASVADVCQRIGYTNVSHFIKVFQKSEGITPARYRDETSE